MKYQRLAIFIALVVLSGCAASQPIAPIAPEISRADAVVEARRDAQVRFNFQASGVMASRSGQFWLVDLRTADGAQAHYAIATDGSIRERRLVP